MKILITGGTGYIGKQVVNYLVNNNSNNNIIVTYRNKEKLKDLPDTNCLSTVPFDLNNFAENCYKELGEPDKLIHLAWEGLPNYDKLLHIEENLFSQYKFLKNMIENGLNDLTVIGTCLEYGLQDGCLSEELDTNPITPYGLSKDTLRKFLQLVAKRYNFGLKWIRLFYNMGEGQSKHSLISQLDKALEKEEKVFNMSGGEQLRDYLPVEKVAEYICKIVLQIKTTGIINCCNGKPVPIKEVVEKYLKKQKKKIELNLGYYPYPDYEPMAFWGDNTKLKSILNR